MSRKTQVMSSKFGRPRAQRKALIRSLAASLILYESIETTMPKAKAVSRYTERLVGKAKKGKKSLHQRRIVIDALGNLEAAHKLVDDVAPKLTDRNSGYFRVERLGLRSGDSAQMAKVSFITDLKSAKKQAAKTTAKSPQKPANEKSPTQAQATPKSTPSKETKGKISQPTASQQVTKRSGVRGNR